MPPLPRLFWFRPARALTAFACVFGGLCSNANGAVIFQDGFESGVLGSEWITSGTNTWRVAINSDYGPATGAKHLVLDDSVDNATNSVAEATLKLDLTYKKNVVLTFAAKSLGNEPNNPPTSNFSSTRAYDGVAISVNGGLNWRTVQSLANVSTTYTMFSVPLDPIVSALGGSYGQEVQIRFSEYDNSPAPIDGIAIDDVVVTADDDLQSAVELPSPLIEGTGPQTGYVVLSYAPTYDLALNLVASPTGQLAIPASVVVPAGQTSVSFEFSPNDDTLTNLTRSVSVTATAPGVTARAGTVTIYDDEAPKITLVLPAQVREGVRLSKANASVVLDHAANASFQLNVTTSPPGQVEVYSSFLIYSGQTRYDFSVNAADDLEFDGDVLTTVTVSAPGIPSASAQTVAVDNDVRSLSLTLPASVQEDGTVTATVSSSGYLETDLVVQLHSSDPSEASIPATVTIPAGTLSNDFTITGHDNAQVDGSRSITITAEAPMFASASAVMTLRDNEVGGYVVSLATDIVDVSAPVSFTVSAADKEGNKIIGGSGTVNVELIRADGSSQPANPPTLTLTGTDTTGTITLPPGVTAPLRIRVTDAAMKSGLSGSFDLMRVLPIGAADLVWDPVHQRIYGSISQAASAYPNRVIAIDPATGEITGSATVGDDPGQLALTSGGEALYVALKASGAIARIDPQTMSVVSTFPVGSTSSGPLFATDMCTVIGQPNVVVVLRANPATSYTSELVAYDNGVKRPNIISNATMVEPAAEPGIVLAAAGSFTVSLSRVQVNNSGLTIVSSGNPRNVSAAAVSDGYLLATSAGNLIDGVGLRLLGNFFPEYSYGAGAVRPDSAAQRVYFVDSKEDNLYEYDVIDAYDSKSLALIRQLTIPFFTAYDGNTPSTLGSFIRWGSTGLAYRTSQFISIVDAPDLVASDSATDLSVTLAANPATVASAGSPITYNVQVKNNGSAVAHHALLTATLSEGQVEQGVTASSGQVSLQPATISIDLGDLPAGATASLALTATPLQAGFVTCTAKINSSSVDLNFNNNAAFKMVPVGFKAGQDAINKLPLNANNIIYDRARDLIWASFPTTEAPPLRRSLVSINPHTGEISDPIPVGGDPRSESIALSGNGRYIYVGYVDTPAVGRIDLTTPSYDITQVPLNTTSDGPIFPWGIEVLDGDGTSFLVSGYYSGDTAVFDGTTLRGTLASYDSVDRIVRTTTPNVFAGITIDGTPVHLKRIKITTTGPTIEKDVTGVLQGDIVASGGLVLTSYGDLGDSGTLVKLTNFGIRGTPCLDAANQRGYITYAQEINAFDTASGNLVDVLPLPTTQYYGWATQCVRWGADGFAIAGDSSVFLFRWSTAVPSNIDQNNDGIADSWEAKYFGKLDVDLAADPDGDVIPNALEYFFGLSPLTSNGSPLQIGIEDVAGGGEVMHLIYTRRADVSPVRFRYETSTDVAQWTAATGVTETVLETQIVGGVQLQTIDAAIPAPNAIRSFARVKWLTP